MKRRTFIKAALASSGMVIAPQLLASSQSKINSKIIPSTGEALPVIGMGSFVNFNFPDDAETIIQRTALLEKFFSLGGKIIDSSPMYGSAEKNLGLCMRAPDAEQHLFSATKVWTSSVKGGKEGIEVSRKLWQVDQFDLLQVHNLVAWEGHLETLFEMKKQGKLRYVGITTSHGRRHKDLEKIMKKHPIDFVQATYNVQDREVEQRILPVAKERGIAFIANRPFQRGYLIDWANTHELPSFSKELQCDNWASLLLKYTVSHPAVTCAIPATTNMDHLQENMGALNGPLPDKALRKEIQDYVAML